MKSVRTASLFFILTLALSSILFAQNRFPARGHGSERIEQFKKVRLMEALHMDEETSIRFFARYNKFVEALREVQNEHNTLIDKLQTMTKSTATNSEIEVAIKDVGLCEEKIAETRSTFIEGLKEVLSIKQIADYVVFERNFNKNLREIMRDIAKDRWNRQNRN